MIKSKYTHPEVMQGQIWAYNNEPCMVTLLTGLNGDIVAYPIRLVDGDAMEWDLEEHLQEEPEAWKYLYDSLAEYVAALYIRVKAHA